VFAAAIVISAPAAFAAQQTLRGTATLADGTPLAKGGVNLIDNANHSLAAVANNAGRFRFNVIGLTAPFLLQSIPAGSGSPLFYDMLKARHRQRGCLYRSYFEHDSECSRHDNADRIHDADRLADREPSSGDRPTIQNLILHWLKADKVSGKKFSFDGLNFAASNARFGKVLRQTCDQSACGGSTYASGSETLAISDGTTTQNIVFTSTVQPADRRSAALRRTALRLSSV